MHFPVIKKTGLNRRQLLRLMGMGTTAIATAPLLSGCAVDPVTGNQQFMIMSEEEEISIDTKQSPYQFSTDYGPLQDQQLNGYIDRVGRELTQNSHRPHMPFSFRGVNAAYINAYAFPGGSIAVTRGILVELENEAELAGLLGHEIGHVCARHTAERSSKGMVTSVLLAGATIATSAAGYGGATDLVQGLGQLGAGALLSHYSRDNEREADYLGMEYMTRSGYSPEGMVGLMEILMESGKHQPSAIELMFATHPMSNERFNTAEKAAATTYLEQQSYPLNKERYMDNTSALRKIKPAITALQNGNKSLGKKQYQEAADEFSKALAIVPNDYAALVMMAKCQLALNQETKAQQFSLRGTEVYPQEAQAQLLVGITSISSKKYDQALQYFSEYDRLLPGNPEITFYKGYSLEGMEKRDQAASEYKKFLQKVRKGEQAQHAYKSLVAWGYAK